jgi:hypothetical protein
MSHVPDTADTFHLPTLLQALALGAVAFIAMGQQPAHARGPYVSAGVPGLVAGYAYTVNEKLGLRAEAGTTGTMDKTDSSGGVRFDGQLKYNRVGLFSDFFPFSGGFRLTGGVTINRASLALRSRFNNTSVTVNGKTVTATSSDYYNADLKYPTLMPYIGIGWGHQAKPTGFGITADVGVSIGRPKLTASTNLVGAGGGAITQDDIDAKTQEIYDDVGALKLLPSASVGINFRY